jgi:hypothetical protein
MTQSQTIACPHCSAGNEAYSAFCVACGKALPAMQRTGPRVITYKDVAFTPAGRAMQADALLATARRAARSLLSIGVIYLIFGGIQLMAIMAVPSGLASMSPYMIGLLGSEIIGGALYVAMYYVAKVSPLIATIAGLVIYMAKWGLDAWMAVYLRHGRGTAPVLTAGWLRLIMVAYLIGGITAAVRHRRLLQQQATAQQPMPVIPMQ